MPRLKPAGPKSKEDRPMYQRAEQAEFLKKGKASKIKNAGRATAAQIKAKPKANAKAARDAASSRIKRTKAKPTRFRTA